MKFFIAGSLTNQMFIGKTLIFYFYTYQKTGNVTE